MSKRTKSAPREALPVPQSDDEATESVARIGILLAERAQIAADCDEAVNRLKAEAAEKARPLTEEIKARTEGLRTWGDAHRQRLTGGKTKTVKLATGTVSWRAAPRKVSLKGVDAVIDAIRTLGLGQFLRVKTEVDKAAMLADPDTACTIKGVTISSEGEAFAVSPATTDLEEVV